MVELSRNLAAIGYGPRIVSSRFKYETDPLQTGISVAIDLTIPVRRSSPDSKDETIPVQSASVETPCGQTTPNPFDFSEMSGQTNAFNNGLTHGADKGAEEDYEGWNALPFASGGYGEASNYGLIDGADMGGEESEGWNRFSFASGGYRQASNYGLTDGADMGREFSEGSFSFASAALRKVIISYLKSGDKRGGGSTRGVADDDQSILIVHTYHYLFVLDLKVEQKPANETQCNPVLLKTIDLIKDGFPLGMGIIKLESKRLYMFGGSIEQSRINSRLAYKKSRKLAYKRSRKQFFYKFNSTNWFLKLTSEVEDTKVPKFSPWVAKIEDKILVLDSKYGFKGRSPRLLEFYDLRSKTWKKFPEIPTPKSWSEETIITSLQRSLCVLVGYKLYIMFGSFDRELFFCLNTRTQQWDDESATNLYESLGMSYVFFPHNGKTISRVDGLKDNQNIIICRIVNLGRIYAYFINDMGSLLCYQDLTDELCRDTNPMPYAGIVFIDMKKCGRMCMVVIDRPISDTIRVSYLEKSILLRHFELKLKKGFRVPKDVSGGPVQNEFLDVQVFKNQRVKLEPSLEQGLLLCDAVFL